VGEAFKRARAEAFEHRRWGDHQELLDANLLRISRASENQREIKTRLTDDNTGLVVGSSCMVMPSNDGQFQVVHGNTAVSVLPQEAVDVVRSVILEAPALNRILPCKVVERGPFGGISLKLDVGGAADE
jgi:hypothetical protein